MRERGPENARAADIATCGSHDPRVNASLAPANKIRGKGERMTRIAIMDRADMNAEQARVYDAAKASSGIVGGPYHAYIRLPKLFEACQDLRASLSSGPLSRREQQIVNLVVARHWSARYPWFAQVRASLAVGIERPVIDAINARKTPDLADARERTCFVVARELLASKGLSDQTYAAAEKHHGAGGPGGAGRVDRQLFDDLHDSQHIRDRSAARKPDPARGVVRLHPCGGERLSPHRAQELIAPRAGDRCALSSPLSQARPCHWSARLIKTQQFKNRYFRPHR